VSEIWPPAVHAKAGETRVDGCTARTLPGEGVPVKTSELNGRVCRSHLLSSKPGLNQPLK
jgi:hypothetical protein